jgi:hypothetical protein
MASVNICKRDRLKRLRGPHPWMDALAVPPTATFLTHELTKDV